MTFTKSYLEFPFGILAYTKTGEGAEPLILLHGIPTSSYLWRDGALRLDERFTVYAVDMLGYGDSDKPELADLSLPAQAEYLVAFATALELRSFHLAAHDIGGGVAQLVAITQPDKIRKLVLIGSVAYDSWPEPNIDRLKDPGWDERLKLRDLRPGFRGAFTSGLVHQDRLTDEMLEGYVGPFNSRAGRMAYLRAARALRTDDIVSRVPEIERIAQETLVLWGRQDPFQDVAYGERLVAALPNARLSVCEDGSHFLPEDCPDWVADRLNAFL